MTQPPEAHTAERMGRGLKSNLRKPPHLTYPPLGVLAPWRLKINPSLQRQSNLIQVDPTSVNRPALTYPTLGVLAPWR
jgi:hypothetical protein